MGQLSLARCQVTKHNNSNAQSFVKLQSKVQTSVLGLGVDFVFPLLQKQEHEQEQEQQEPSPKSIRRV